MMNLLALGLVLTSLVTAGFFTPSPENHHKLKEDVIVKEGHRVVVVEYEKDDGNTKVSISPQDSDEKGVVGNVFDKLSERKMEEDVKLEDETHQRFSPRELVCDAYGKCKHKIASALGKTKEAVVETADKVSGAEEEAKEAVNEAIGRVKDKVTHKAHKAYDKVQEIKESAKDSASEVKDKAVEKAGGVKEGAKEQAGREKRSFHDVIEATKEVKEEAKRNASKKMEGAKETVSEKAKEVGEWVEDASHRMKREGKKELSVIILHAREVAADVFDYIVPAERLLLLTGVLHLMGFSSAYGMCVWVTFASSYVLAGALPRYQFGMVQSKIYPVYFKAMAYSIGMALFGHLMSRMTSLSRGNGGIFQAINLVVSLAMILVNLLCLEPRATKVMLERMKKEKEEGSGKESQATEPTGRAADSTAEIVGRGSSMGQVADSTAEIAGRVSSTGAVATQEKAEEAAARSQIVRLSETLQKLNSYSSFLNILTLMSLTWHLVYLGPRIHMAC